MAIEFELTLRALSDYERIVEYLCVSLQSPKAAKNFEKEFLRVICAACEQPKLFSLSRHAMLAEKGYRALHVNNYVVLYKSHKDKLVITHIFHQSQDYARLV
jgi:plasmid stabilization system protein ParE